MPDPLVYSPTCLLAAEVSAIHRHFDGSKATAFWEISNRTGGHINYFYFREIIFMRNVPEAKLQYFRAAVRELGILINYDDIQHPQLFSTTNTTKDHSNLTMDEVNLILSFGSVSAAWDYLAPKISGKVGRMLFYRLARGESGPRYKVEAVSEALQEIVSEGLRGLMKSPNQ